VIGTANQSEHRLHRFVIMPGSGSHGSALIARASTFSRARVIRFCQVNTPVH
jgi:hypothetical protein